MNDSSPWTQYEQRISRVSDHIHNHLDDDLDMTSLAQVACLSTYHWHRIYRAIIGETTTATIKRLRLSRAADDLVRSDASISKIAARAGYPDTQSFNRIFKKSYGLPPGKYREQSGIGSLVAAENTEDNVMYQVKMEAREDILLAGLKHSGSYNSVGEAFEKLNALAATRGLYAPNQHVIGIYYDDPDVVEESNLRAFAGLTVMPSLTVEPPLETTTIAGGNYAVFRYQGPYSNIESCYEWIFGDWLKNSGETLRDEPGFAEYLNPMEKTPAKLLSDIYMPLV